MIYDYKMFINSIWDKIMYEQIELDSDLVDMVNENFWDLI